MSTQERRAGTGSGGLTTELDEVGTTLVLHVAGSIDLSTAPALAAAVGDALKRRPPVLIVDFTDVIFLATAGITIVLEAQRKSAEHELVFRLVAAGPLTIRPLQILGIDELLDCHPSLDAALHAA